MNFGYINMQVLDTVALLEDLPEKNLKRGQVGTLVEELAQGVFEVEFSNSTGHTYALVTLKIAQLMKLYHEPQPT